MSKDGWRGVSGFVSQRPLFRTQQMDNFGSFECNNWTANLALIKANSRGARLMLNGLELRVLQSVATESIPDRFAVEEMAGMQWLWLLKTNHRHNHPPVPVPRSKQLGRAALLGVRQLTDIQGFGSLQRCLNLKARVVPRLCGCDVPPLGGRNRLRFLNARGQKELWEPEGLQTTRIVPLAWKLVCWSLTSYI